MATYSIAEARNNLSKLVERAERGETITLTRHGKVAARLMAPTVDERIQSDDWKAELMKLADRATPLVDPNFDSTALIRQMRDED